ncbi:MAG TPA: dTDP-4-dehydrorhamnose reductase [Desulfatiglandales bacterium]
MKILLLGSKGMLGSDCRTVLSENYEILSPDKKELDIVSWDKVIDRMHHLHPEIVLNCAAVTDLDVCEESRHSYMVKKVNVEGPRNIAQASARYDCKVIQISSDQVFDGEKAVPQPYFEDDTLDPLSAYGRSKMESEIAVRENAPDYMIIRTGWLYGMEGDNFVKALLASVLGKKKSKKVKVVENQLGSPTWSYRLAQQIQELIHTDGKGTYHATAEGYCSRLEYARFILDKLNLKASLEPCSLAECRRKAKRPANCILENRILKKCGINLLPDWKEDLDLFLDQFGEDLIKQAKASGSK